MFRVVLGLFLVSALGLTATSSAQEGKTKTSRVFMPDFETKGGAVTKISVIQVLDAKKGKSQVLFFDVAKDTKFILETGAKKKEFDAKSVLSDSIAQNYFKKDVWVTVSVHFADGNKHLEFVKFTNKKQDMNPLGK